MTPDLCTLGKAVGGGFPLSVFGGRRDIMDRLMPKGDCQHSGTYNGHPSRSRPAWPRCGAYRSRASTTTFTRWPTGSIAACKRMLRAHGIAGRVQGLGARFGIYFGVDERGPQLPRHAAHHDREQMLRFIAAAIDDGVYFHDYGGAACHHGFCAAMTLADVDEALCAARSGTGHGCRPGITTRRHKLVRTSCASPSASSGRKPTPSTRCRPRGATSRSSASSAARRSSSSLPTPTNWAASSSRCGAGRSSPRSSAWCGLPAWPSGRATPRDVRPGCATSWSRRSQRRCRSTPCCWRCTARWWPTDAPDVEGEVLAALRDLIGPTMPLVATLDLHANVTERMVRAADALVLYHTAPHIDVFETGQRAAAVLRRILVDGARPVTAFGRRFPRWSRPSGPTRRTRPASATICSAGCSSSNARRACSPPAWRPCSRGSTFPSWAPRCSSSPTATPSSRERLPPDWPTSSGAAARLSARAGAAGRGGSRRHANRDGLTVLTDSADATTSGAPGRQHLAVARAAEIRLAAAGAGDAGRAGGGRRGRPARRGRRSIAARRRRARPALFAADRLDGAGRASVRRPLRPVGPPGAQPADRHGAVGRVAARQRARRRHLAQRTALRAAVVPGGRLRSVRRAGAGGQEPLRLSRRLCGAAPARSSWSPAPGCAPADFWHYDYPQIDRPLWPWDEIDAWQAEPLIFAR